MNDREIELAYEALKARRERKQDGVPMAEEEAKLLLENFSGRTVEQAIEAGQAYRHEGKIYIRKQ